MYTEAFGRASYLVSRSRGKKSTVSKALFIPFVRSGNGGGALE